MATDYQSNSMKPKGEPPKESLERKAITPVVKGKKKSLIWRIIEPFLPEDLTAYKRNLWRDIVVPSIKKQIDDAFHAFIWEADAPKRSSGNAGKFDYNASWKSSNPGVTNRRYSGVFAVDDIVVPTRRDGEIVLEELGKIILAYGVASVADLCELCEFDSSYTDNKYGWKNLEGAEVVRVYDGYCLKLPRPVPLD